MRARGMRVDGVGELGEVGVVAGGAAGGAGRVGDGGVVVGERRVERLDEGGRGVVADGPRASDERGRASAEERLGEPAERRRPRREAADVARVEEDERALRRGIHDPAVGQVVAQFAVGVAGERHVLDLAERGEQQLLRLRGAVAPASVAGEVQQVESVAHQAGDPVGVVGVDGLRTEPLLEEPALLRGVRELEALVGVLGADVAHAVGGHGQLDRVRRVVDPPGEPVAAEEPRSPVVGDADGRHEVHDLPRHVELARGLDDQPVELVGRRVPEQVEHVAAEEGAREAHAELAQAVQSVPRAVVAIADVAEFVADAADAPVGARDERRLVDEAGLAFPCVAGHRDPDAQRRVGAHDGLVDADAREDDELGVGLDHVGGHLGGQRLGRLAHGDDLGRDPQGGEREVGVLAHDERHLAVAGQRSDQPEAVLVDPVGRARQSRHDGGGLIADQAEAPQRDRHGQVALGVDPDRLRGAAGAGGCLEPTSAQPEAHLELGVDDDAARHLGVDVREGEVGGLLACPAHARRIVGAELRAGAEAVGGLDR